MRKGTAFLSALGLLCIGLFADPRVSPVPPLASAPFSGSARSDSAHGGALYEPVHDAAILKALDRIYRAEYDSAEAVLAALPDCPARAYFRGLVRINRYDDLGDTAALFAAEALWERLDRAADTAASVLLKDGNYPVYRGLAKLQLSYVASVTGGRIRAARLGRKAVDLLRPYSGYAEAAAALALYEYYKAALLKGIAWLPFVSADRDRPLENLEAAIPRSRYLREILRTSLIWIHYDAGRYREGLEPIREFLARYPGNRTYRQMRADFRYRQGDLDAARRMQDSLLAEYRGLGRLYSSPAYLPLGYLSAVGNLAKLDASQKRRDWLDRDLTLWYSPRYKGMLKWLPASLVREVDSLKK